MDNYKIKVKDEQNFKEVVSLINTLGYGVNFSYSNASGEVVKGLFLKGNGLVEWTHRDTYFDLNDSKELTLPQLRDLVASKNKTVREFLEPQEDGTYKVIEWTCLTCPPEDYVEIPEGSEDYRSNNKFYKDSGVRFYSYKGEWLLSEQTGRHQILWQRPTRDPALISGDVALANVHKLIVQYLHDDEPYGRWTTITDNLWSQYHLGMFLDPDTKFKFRFKPQTIKLELELPKPFEPKEGDTFYYLTDGEECGFVKCEHDWTFDPKELNFGAWRTEDDVKKAVEQLRKIRGTNS